MANEPISNAPYYEENQDDGHITINEQVNQVANSGYLVVQDRHLTAPPTGASNGQKWLVATSATGDWLGHDGEVAIYYDGWTFRDLANGEVFTILDEKLVVVNDARTIDTIDNTW